MTGAPGSNPGALVAIHVDDFPGHKRIGVFLKLLQAVHRAEDDLAAFVGDNRISPRHFDFVAAGAEVFSGEWFGRVIRHRIEANSGKRIVLRP